jgi:hypothetical protein
MGQCGDETIGSSTCCHCGFSNARLLAAFLLVVLAYIVMKGRYWLRANLLRCHIVVQPQQCVFMVGRLLWHPFSDCIVVSWLLWMV